MGYYPMTKSVASLVHYQEQAMACNQRYLDALEVVDDPSPAFQDLRELTEPKVVNGRSYFGLIQRGVKTPIVRGGAWR